jgi:hypothetical protein
MPDRWPDPILYRIAYGLAANALDDRPDIPPAGIPAHVLARLAIEAKAPEKRRVIVEAVGDALEGRRPRW